MRNDQIIRAVAAVSVAAIYTAHVGLNGSGPVKTGFMGAVSPFVIAVAAELALAFPEIIDMIPWGPNRTPTAAIADTPNSDPRDEKK